MVHVKDKWTWFILPANLVRGVRETSSLVEVSHSTGFVSLLSVPEMICCGGACLQTISLAAFSLSIQS